MSILAVGSIAFDSIATPAGKVENALGGSATYFSLSASYFTDVRMVAVVGEDFTAEHENILKKRKIDTRGIITTIAGAGKDGFSGDGGPATAAELFYPWGIVFDQAGNLYIADAGNARVRRIDSAGIIQTVAGS